MNKPASPLEAAALLPHKSRMCCIRRLLECSEVAAVAEAELRPGHILLNADGLMDPCGFIELAAQTAGAMYGEGSAVGSVSLAMLASLQKVTILHDARVNDVLRITVNVIGELEGILSLQFMIHRQAAGVADRPLLAQGRLTAYIPENAARIAAMLQPCDTETDFSAGRNLGLKEAVWRCAIDAPGRQDATQTDGVLAGGFVFPYDFAGFDGHFPGNPIVPGIAQIICAVRTAMGSAAKLTGVKRCKFLRPVRPLEELRVRAEVNGAGRERSCHARLTANGESCAEMTFTFEMPLV